MAISIKKKLAAGFAVGAAVIIGCTLPQVLPGKPAANRAHASLDLVRGKAAGYIDISAQHRVTALNPKGWQWPAIEREGWEIILPEARRLRMAGAELLFLWEVTGQCEGIGTCMAWTSRTTLMRGWSETMRLSWPTALAKLRAMGIEPVWYMGCASNIYGGECGPVPARLYDDAYIRKFVEDVAFVRMLGVRAVAFDAFSWTIEVDEPFAARILSALRADPRTKDMTLFTEGQLPANLTDARRAFYLRHMGVLELARGGPGKLAINDHNLSRIDDARDDRLIPNHVRFIWFHGSMWEPGDVDAVTAWIKTTGSHPIDNRAGYGEWKKGAN